MTTLVNHFKEYKILILLSLIFIVRLSSFCGVDLAHILACSTNPALKSSNNVSNASSQKFSKWSSLQNLAVLVENAIYNFRQNSAENIRKHIPSPHSELLLGLTLGINDISKTPTFNDVLRTTGTIHVVVVSGYNISLVFGLVVSRLGSQYKLKPLITALFFTLIYAVIAGFEPPVVRAWIMGATAALVKFEGRKVPAMNVLLFSALLMLVLDPLYIFSMSFQLSFLAALGLVHYSETFSFISKLLAKNLGKVAFFAEDLVSTLSAQVFVWPLISYKFEQVSLISPIVNALILWTTPIATILGGIFVFLAFLNPMLTKIFSYIVIVPLDIFVRGCYFFAKIPFALITYKPPWYFVSIYFIFAAFMPYFSRKFMRSNMPSTKNYVVATL